MDTEQLFAAYAADFEITYEDDDWSRVEKHFAADAVYEVKGSGMACRIQGRAAILAGLKKSLDGFDRRMKTRQIALTSEPEVTPNSFSVDWSVTYSVEGSDDYVLKGSSYARFVDGELVELVDSYPPQTDAIAGPWMAKWAPDVDPSYV